jgi:hypothetical protein
VLTCSATIDLLGRWRKQFLLHPLLVMSSITSRWRLELLDRCRPTLTFALVDVHTWCSVTYVMICFGVAIKTNQPRQVSNDVEARQTRDNSATLTEPTSPNADFRNVLSTTANRLRFVMYSQLQILTLVFTGYRLPAGILTRTPGRDPELRCADETLKSMYCLLRDLGWCC